MATRQRIQMVLLREGGMTQPEISAAMGVSLSTVNRAHMAYDRGGLRALEPKPVGGRMRQNMTLAEEAALLAGFAKAAGAGKLLKSLRAAKRKRPTWRGRADAGSASRMSRRRMLLKKGFF